jgi:hypothetical protein
VNAKAKINVPFGAWMTQVANLPLGAQRDLVDPFAEKRKPWGVYVTLAVVLSLACSWYFGKLDKMVPYRIRSTTMFGAPTPACQLPPATSTSPAETSKP